MQAPGPQQGHPGVRQASEDIAMPGPMVPELIQPVSHASNSMPLSVLPGGSAQHGAPAAAATEPVFPASFPAVPEPVSAPLMHRAGPGEMQLHHQDAALPRPAVPCPPDLLQHQDQLVPVGNAPQVDPVSAYGLRSGARPRSQPVPPGLSRSRRRSRDLGRYIDSRLSGANSLPLGILENDPDPGDVSEGHASDEDSVALTSYRVNPSQD